MTVHLTGRRRIAVLVAGALCAGCGRTELSPFVPRDRRPGVDAGAGDVSPDPGIDSADLASLVLSVAPLLPPFTPDQTSYETSDVGALLETTTVTAVPVSPRAQITLGGTLLADTPLGSGVPSAPLAFMPGANFITVTVTSPGGAQKIYTVSKWQDGWIFQRAYVKASNTDIGDHFGAAIALSGDTLVVGAAGEGSVGGGVNPFTQEDNSLPGSGAVYVFGRSSGAWSQQAFLKASNPDELDWFGYAVALDGDTLVVGAPHESSGAGADPADNSVLNAGAVYVFTRSGGIWSQQAMLKASNPGPKDAFGCAVALSGDTLAVGAYQESSGATGVDSGGEDDDSAPGSGAAYIFVRAGATWTQQAYVKASNTGAGDLFGFSLALEGDTLAVGAEDESSAATGVNAAGQDDNSASRSGAVYVFARSNGAWAQQAYVKASNTDAIDLFGSSVALSGDTLAVGAILEDSRATGVFAGQDGSSIQGDNSVFNAGAVYVFGRSGTTWTQDAYIKPGSNSREAQFGQVALAGDVLAVGAVHDPSAATGVDTGPGSDTVGPPGSGAVHVFARRGGVWFPRHFVKASNTGAGDAFGFPVVVSRDTLVVGASLEDSAARGVNTGDQADDSATDSGAVYVFR